MSKEGFTPGRWYFLESHNHDDEFSRDHPLTICSEGNDDLANIYSSADSTVSISREQAIANAHLIAAAPELYEALKAMLELHEAHHNQPIHAQARAALAKARGEA